MENNILILKENLKYLILHDEEIREIIFQIVTKRGYNSSTPLEARICEFLQKRLKVPTNILGYRYLVEAVKIVVVDPSNISRVFANLYAEIANKFETTIPCVERSIRHAIHKSFDQMECPEEIFVYKNGRVPTNSQFIATVAEYIRFNKDLQ